MVPFDETSLLLLVIQRELRYLNARRELRALEVGLRDAEKRCQSLLENSRDAIAYVHDGMRLRQPSLSQPLWLPKHRRARRHAHY